jgi:hypothetical protein
MPVTVTCGCGSTYELRDEFAGQTLRCPSCQRTIVAPAISGGIASSPPPPLNYAGPMGMAQQGDGIFDRYKFLMRQKVMSINEKYFVSDEQNRPIVFVERPAHALQNLGAILVGLLAGAIVIGAMIFVAGTLFRNNESAAVLCVVVGVVLGVAAALCVGIPLSPKRHVSFYRDESRTQKLLEILQDAKFQPITATYTLCDESGQVLARLHKNILYNLFRKRWYCYAPDGSLIVTAMEDSLILSLLRRLLGSFYGLLRTNFIFVTPHDEQVIGEFNRKFTLFDRYVLDLSADPQRRFDRRIAMAMGIMLDTGERR